MENTNQNTDNVPNRDIQKKEPAEEPVQSIKPPEPVKQPPKPPSGPGDVKKPGKVKKPVVNQIVREPELASKAPQVPEDKPKKAPIVKKQPDKPAIESSPKKAPKPWKKYILMGVGAFFVVGVASAVLLLVVLNRPEPAVEEYVEESTESTETVVEKEDTTSLDALQSKVLDIGSVLEELNSTVNFKDTLFEDIDIF